MKSPFPSFLEQGSCHHARDQALIDEMYHLESFRALCFHVSNSIKAESPALFDLAWFISRPADTCLLSFSEHRFYAQNGSCGAVTRLASLWSTVIPYPISLATRGKNVREKEQQLVIPTFRNHCLLANAGGDPPSVKHKLRCRSVPQLRPARADQPTLQPRAKTRRSRKSPK